MTMQRRHFELIAEVVKDQRWGLALPRQQEVATALDNVALAMASKLASTNPNFNRDRFLRACGVEG